MSMNPCSTIKNALIRTTLALALGGLTPIVGGQCRYDVEVIEGPACGSGAAIITGKAINDAGIVALEISCNSTDNTAIWDGGPGYTLLTRPPGMASATPIEISNVGGLNGSAVVVGEGTYPEGYRAFLHDGKKFVNLGVLPGATSSDALDVNDESTVVGWSGDVVDAEPFAAVLWHDRVIQELPVGPGAQAFAINQMGDIAGRYTPLINDRYQIQPFILDNTGFLHSLPVLPDTNNVRVEGMNDSRVVVGNLFVILGETSFLKPAVCWRNNELVILPTLPGFPAGLVRDVNNASVMVGNSENLVTFFNRPTVWYYDRPFNVNDFLPQGTNLIIAGDLWSVNDAGQIVARARDLTTGEGFAVRLTPSKQITGDTNCDGLVGIVDLLHVIGDWNVPGGPSDVNFDRMVNLPDLLEVITRWGALSN